MNTKRRGRILNSQPDIENLLSVGRNGEFAHIFMEDVYWRTRKKVRDLIECKLKDNKDENAEIR